jgi:hypothetical protein
MEKLGAYWTDIHEIRHSKIFPKFVEKIKLSLKSDKNNAHFTWKPKYICDCVLLNSSQNEKCFIKVVKNTKTHRLCSATFFPPRKSCHLWDNVEKKYGTARQATEQACALHAANKDNRHTLRICNTYCFNTTKMVTRTRLSVTLIRTLHALFEWILA